VTGVEVIIENFLPEVRKMFPRSQYNTVRCSAANNNNQNIIKYVKYTKKTRGKTKLLYE